jgi:hypothetical protein
MYRKTEMRRPGGKLYNHRGHMLEGWHQSVSCQGWMMERIGSRGMICTLIEAGSECRSECSGGGCLPVSYCHFQVLVYCSCTYTNERHHEITYGEDSSGPMPRLSSYHRHYFCPSYRFRSIEKTFLNLP